MFHVHHVSSGGDVFERCLTHSLTMFLHYLHHLRSCAASCCGSPCSGGTGPDDSASLDGAVWAPSRFGIGCVAFALVMFRIVSGSDYAVAGVGVLLGSMCALEGVHFNAPWCRAASAFWYTCIAHALVALFGFPTCRLWWLAAILGVLLPEDLLAFPKDRLPTALQTVLYR